MGSTTTTTTTIILVFTKVTLIPLLSKASFHFENLSLSPSIVTLIRTKSSAYINSLSATSGKLSDNIYHHCKKIRQQNRSLVHPTLTLNSSDNSKSTLTLVLAPSYTLITDLANTYGIFFFLIAHANTFLGFLSTAFTRSTKHI